MLWRGVGGPGGAVLLALLLVYILRGLLGAALRPTGPGPGADRGPARPAPESD